MSDELDYYLSTGGTDPVPIMREMHSKSAPAQAAKDARVCHCGEYMVGHGNDHTAVEMEMFDPPEAPWAEKDASELAVTVYTIMFGFEQSRRDEAAAEIERYVARREHMAGVRANNAERREDALKARLAERAPSPSGEAILDCIPSNWLDPLLTGPAAVIHQYSCLEIEALLNSVRARIIALLSSPPSPGAKPIDDEADWS
jgi:hypothetical protein